MQNHRNAWFQIVIKKVKASAHPKEYKDYSEVFALLEVNREHQGTYTVLIVYVLWNGFP